MNHRKLYTLLLKKSRELARRERRGIFTNRTLREMSKRLPLTEVEFRRIHGVGPVKTERYAKIFLQIIHDYCVENGLRKLGQNSELEEKRVSRQNKTPAEADPAPSVANDDYADPRKYSPRLYQLLRAERNRIAAEEGVNAFQVFWNRTLKQMAVYLPQTRSEFSNIYMIGPWKTERYADRILPIIRDFCRENGVSYDRIEPRQREFLDWLRR